MRIERLLRKLSFQRDLFLKDFCWRFQIPSFISYNMYIYIYTYWHIEYIYIIMCISILCTYVYSFEPFIPIHFDQWNGSLSIHIFSVKSGKIILVALRREVFQLFPEYCQTNCPCKSAPQILNPFIFELKIPSFLTDLRGSRIIRIKLG